jgi:hypothetical protein
MKIPDNITYCIEYFENKLKNITNEELLFLFYEIVEEMENRSIKPKIDKD